MRSHFFRVPVALMRWCYRLTGGRFGLAQGVLDLDAVAITFAVDRVINPLGAETGDPLVEGDSLIIPVVECDVSVDRAGVLIGVGVAIRDLAPRRNVVLRFFDGDEVVERT